MMKYVFPLKSLRLGILALTLILYSSCNKEETKYDLVLYNADIYTVSDGSPKFDAVGIKNGKIVSLGKTDDLMKEADPKVQTIDIEGKFMIPGLIEGHGHFSNLGISLQNLNFLADTSWQQITQKVKDKLSTVGDDEWIYGRGWHQEKWTIDPIQSEGKYPTHHVISELSPNHPIVLVHASGHSLFANDMAMRLARITKETPDPEGGKIIRNSNDEAIGVFEENAMQSIYTAYENYLNEIPDEKRKQNWLDAIRLAEEECLAKGITSFQDAGSKFYELAWYQEMAENAELDLRLWVMVRHSAAEMEGKLADLRMLNVGNGFYTCRAIKSELDGALGAHGAWLIEDYDDKPGFTGQNTTEVLEVEKIAQLAYDHNMQLCVHSIGDKANQETLNIFEKYKNKNKELDLRWRVEHAQHLAIEDIPRFRELGAIASMQGVHCTSDAPFVETRLGEQRAKEGAYAWRALLDAGAVVVNGTDAPVEDVNPLASIYASVTRRRENPDMEFFPEQRMTREEAIYSYTMAPAYAGFEENEKGSIEIGKYADFTILDTNLLTCTDEELKEAKVLKTIVDGIVRYDQAK